MLRRIIICDHRDKLVATLETILKHWGYRVLAVSSAEKALELLHVITPNLFLVSTALLKNSPLLQQHIDYLSSDATAATVLIDEDSHTASGFSEYDRLGFPFDIFELFALVQKHLEKIPRRNLRLDTTLPGLVCNDNSEQFADVVSLSSHGLFVKSGLRVEPGQQVTMILPLFGLKQEVEVPCRVLYMIQPCQENNYLQGFGVEFVSPSSEVMEAVRKYLEQRLLGEITEQRVDAATVEVDQLQTYSDQTKLRLIMKHHEK